jgi:hypothetical protein
VRGVVPIVCGLLMLAWVWWIPRWNAGMRSRVIAAQGSAERWDARMPQVLRIARPAMFVVGLAAIVIGVLELVL